MLLGRCEFRYSYRGGVASLPLLCVFLQVCFFFFKQKTAYEMRISDWSSDVCSSDLLSLRRSEVGLRVSTPLLRVTAEYLHLDSAAATSELFNRRDRKSVV